MMWGSANMRRVLGLIPLLFALACDGSPVGVNCTDISVVSVSVLVRDAVTGEFLTDSATMIQREGAYVDSVTYNFPPGVALDFGMWVDSAEERPGTYDVSVRRPGYALWQTFDVRVTRDACHVQTVVLEANLLPLP